MYNFVPEKRHIDDVKRELPPVRIMYAGEMWWGRVTGRLNQFASVSPYQRVKSKKSETWIMGPVFQFSWDSVCRAVVNGTALNTD